MEDCDASRYAKGYCEKHYNRWRRWGDPARAGRPNYEAMSNADPMKRLSRIRTRVDMSDPNACWIWPGAKTAGGYGQMRGGPGVKVYTHRAAYEALIGPIPEGLVLDHLCRNRACCNPAHLEPVTDAVNLERGIGHGSETHCPHGHPYGGDNLIVRKNGSRACRSCERRYNRERWARQTQRN